MTTYGDRLLGEYIKIIESLVLGAAPVDVDEEYQGAIAELFTNASVALHLRMNREDAKNLSAQVEALRASK